VRFCHIWTYEMAKGYVLYAKYLKNIKYVL
jgi:hypothetical protein